MKLGHKKKFTSPGFIQQAREDLKREEKEQKEQRKRRKRKEEEQRKREKEDQAEQRKLEQELSKIERERILGKARSTRDVEDLADVKQEASKPTKLNTAQLQAIHLPDWKGR
jgi:hypothetical protein